MVAATSQTLSPEVMIPDLLRRLPGARAVLDRYGLRGCGGELGPHETLRFFAQAHDVPVDRLLRELGAAAQVPAPPAHSETADDRWADGAYRPFFMAGIATILTLGATWGAYLLLKIAFAGTFSAASVHEVNAHGHAQIFGWVGLFVMGCAYQAFPRFKHTSLAQPDLARLSFWLMVVGLVVRSTCEPFAEAAPFLAWLASAASLVEVTAVGLFCWVIAATWKASGKGLAFYDWYILSALFWFLAQSVYEAVYLAATLTTPREGLVALVGTWQAPLRDLQIHGFALLMILGVSQRMLHHMYGFPAPSPRLSLWALIGLNLAVVGEATGLVLMRVADRAWAALWLASVLLLTACVMALLANWRAFGRPPQTDRGLKFVRAAYVWLLVALAMLVLLPGYQFGLLPWAAPEGYAASIGFSHAYYGATRHAITVGFISLMIVGVAAKIVPTLRGVDLKTLPALWLPFVLINLGCTLRVAGQVLADFFPSVFLLTGVSGCLEVAGLTIWGVHLWRIMTRRDPDGWPEVGAAEDRPITVKDSVAAVLDRRPELLAVFLEHGFRPLANPVLRRTAARGVSIELACRIVGVDAARFLAALNARAGLRPPRPNVSLAVVEPPPEPLPAESCSCCEERSAAPAHS
jgi:hypothetical protein